MSKLKLNKSLRVNKTTERARSTPPPLVTRRKLVELRITFKARNAETTQIHDDDETMAVKQKVNARR